VAAKTISMRRFLTYTGRIRTPYSTLRDCPRNIDPKGLLCELQVDEEFKEMGPE
jgi:hypothetical protein